MREPPLIKHILARHGARPDLRLFRNPTAKAWVGPFRRRNKDGSVVLGKGSTMIFAGLAEGASDLIGITWNGTFIAIEVKTGKQKPTAAQKKFLKMVDQFNGISGVVYSVEDVDRLLGKPTKGVRR